MSQSDRIPLGELLTGRGLVGESHIAFSLQAQKVTGERVGEVLERLGMVSQYDIAVAIAEQEGLDYLDVDHAAPTPEALQLFNMKLCLSNHFLPLSVADGVVEAASAFHDPVELAETIQRHSGLKTLIRQGEKGKIGNAVRLYYFFLENPVETLFKEQAEQLARDEGMTRPTGPILEHLFHLAVAERASDIHFRALEKTLNVSFRIDGVLRSMFALPKSLKRLISAIKIEAEMDIAEQRLPQDGSFSAHILGADYDIRASSLTSPFGENLTLRLHPIRSDFMNLRQLGFAEEDARRFQRLAARPYGLILATGPTGSGKTSTLNAAIRTLNLVEKNVLTVEDPIESRMHLALQTEINVKAGYTFAEAPGRLLRHDPDVILLGEIRDRETARAALSAAETGHMVFSTLHANAALGAISRLRALGVPAFMLADALSAVLSQRLVRTLCRNCKREEAVSPEERAFLDAAGEEGVEVLWRGAGCASCGGTGFYGRTMVYELLEADERLLELIAEEAPLEKLSAHVRQGGFRTMAQVGAAKVRAGETSLEELRRVIGR